MGIINFTLFNKFIWNFKVEGEKMDLFKKLMCTKGLILSLEEQLYQYFQKDNLPENVKDKIVNSYYDAILEQLKEKDANEKPNEVNKPKSTPIPTSGISTNQG